MQKTIGNLIAGIILLMDRSIKPGDVIAVGDTYRLVVYTVDGEFKTVKRCRRGRYC